MFQISRQGIEGKTNISNSHLTLLVLDFTLGSSDVDGNFKKKRGIPAAAQFKKLAKAMLK